jgi:ComF family protein
LREVIHQFKYNRRRYLARPLGRMMRMAGGDVLHGADAVVPVPLHPWRSFVRGFNQADDLARELGLPVWRVLRRRRFGPRQAGQSAGARRRNLADAFALAHLTSAQSRFGGAKLKDRSLVLVDDVLTTGATVDACASVLLDAGVARVAVLTAARTVVGHRALP